LISGSEREDLAHLLRSVDPARVARDPRRAHGLFGDAVEMLRANADLAQAASCPDRPIVEATSACRSALAWRFQRITKGSMTQDV